MLTKEAPYHRGAIGSDLIGCFVPQHDSEGGRDTSTSGRQMSMTFLRQKHDLFHQKLVVVMGLVGFAKEVYEGAHQVKTRPAYIEPVEPCRQWAAYEVMQNQVGAGAHEHPGKGDELKAVECRGAVKFG